MKYVSILATIFVTLTAHAGPTPNSGGGSFVLLPKGQTLDLSKIERETSNLPQATNIPIDFAAALRDALLSPGCVVNPRVLQKWNSLDAAKQIYYALEIIQACQRMNDPGRPKLRDYSEVESAYAKYAQKAPQGEQRITCTGAVFTRDTTNPALGEAYRDPSGLIWGSMNKDYMTQGRAKRYCKAGGARLPTREEFERLAEYMGYGSERGYSPYLNDGKTEVLPGILENWFWSSSADPYNSSFAASFDGDSGRIGGGLSSDYIWSGNGEAVRCVSGR